MGNVIASPPLNNESVKEEETIANPGSIEELHKICKDVFPNNFEGAKIMVNKGLSNHFQISHTLNMSSASPSGYRFGATFVGTKQFGPSEAYPVLLGEMDPSGNLNANIIHKFSNNLTCKYVAQIQNSKFVASQLSADYKGNDSTSSLTLANVDVVNSNGCIVGHYLQSITPRLSLGTELAYQYGFQVPGGQIAILSLVGRYKSPDYSVSATVGQAGLHVCYWQKSSDQIQFGCELETNLRMQEAVGSIGYQVDLPKANLVFRGMLDSNWTVGAVLEKKLQPLPFTFALSGMLNHPKNEFRFGCGLIIG